MTREEFIEKWGASMGHGFTDEELSADLDSLFHPAEGARKVQWSGYGELGNISQKPLQPTAEGAEEILIDDIEAIANKYEIVERIDDDPETGDMRFVINDQFVELVRVAAVKFATLHAQKIADKMVSEKLREELIKYEIHWNFVLRDNAEKVVDEYLKSRER